MTKIGLDELDTIITKELEEYANNTTDTMREVVEEVTDDAVETLKMTSPKRRGKYAKGWKSKATTDTNTALTKTIHNRTPGLTHLLEDGHAKQNGGRVEGKKHIAPVEKQAIQSFEEKLGKKL
ncbi:HK97 gp10 family phage protein [Streptococcus cuniculi]|uniref:HK97 gp10 family phage protein n=1 Tax=Streptococcus cuniculi TaxID=1432788 RepID=A0A4Y9JB82_9STRE|nr:HK97 gp10 family phage protein [Streptococcus cuniculi]MBF0778712.1 HK97 gp10 family phage protein [Streptococcus cuniculi]TFU97346.1 HK97 gp10 family phage protein [Streptococcus cuniculi]